MFKTRSNSCPILHGQSQNCIWLNEFRHELMQTGLTADSLMVSGNYFVAVARDLRMVDLLPIARDNHYHCDMLGYWSLKALLPTVAPELAYNNHKIDNGSTISLAFDKLVNIATVASEQWAPRKSLLAYCQRDMLAMLRRAHYFQGG